MSFYRLAISSFNWNRLFFFSFCFLSYLFLSVIWKYFFLFFSLTVFLFFCLCHPLNVHSNPLTGAADQASRCVKQESGIKTTTLEKCQRQNFFFFFFGHEKSKTTNFIEIWQSIAWNSASPSIHNLVWFKRSRFESNNT